MGYCYSCPFLNWVQNGRFTELLKYLRIQHVQSYLLYSLTFFLCKMTAPWSYAKLLVNTCPFLIKIICILYFPLRINGLLLSEHVLLWNSCPYSSPHHLLIAGPFHFRWVNISFFHTFSPSFFLLSSFRSFFLSFTLSFFLSLFIYLLIIYSIIYIYIYFFLKPMLEDFCIKIKCVVLFNN